MHNIVPKDGIPMSVAKRSVLDEIHYIARKVAEVTTRLETLHMCSTGIVTDINLNAYEAILGEEMGKLAALHARHFVGPAPAQVQDVPRETTGVAA